MASEVMPCVMTAFPAGISMCGLLAGIEALAHFALLCQSFAVNFARQTVATSRVLA